MPTLATPNRRPAITGTRVRDPQAKAEGIAYARNFRIRMKPHFDALYGVNTVHCPTCGSAVASKGDAQ